MVSFLLNNLLLSGADFKCGCLCQTYAVSGGSTFDFAAQTSTAANGSVAHTPTQVLDPAGSGDYVWNPALVDPWTGNTYSWQVGQLTCGTTDGSKCGARFSSYAQSGYCPVTNPKRWAPLAQLPLPFNRPGGGGSGAADPAWGLANGTSPEYYSTPQSGGSGYKYESPGYYYRTSPESPVLVTGASRALALQLAQGMLYTDVTRGVVLPGAAFAALQARVAAFVGAGVAYDTSALGLSNATTRLTELFPLLPISPFMLGTEQARPRGFTLLLLVAFVVSE